MAQTKCFFLDFYSIGVAQTSSLCNKDIERQLFFHRASWWDNAEILVGKGRVQDCAICQSTDRARLSCSGFPGPSLQVIICQTGILWAMPGCVEAGTEGYKGSLTHWLDSCCASILSKQLSSLLLLSTFQTVCSEGLLYFDSFTQSRSCFHFLTLVCWNLCLRDKWTSQDICSGLRG